ncbi:MAG: SIS domain-containing protein [Elusimicrobia bacterium]|nr:SIS domain-containing protein [Elusimicrobiota bacterium]MDE2238251.1 SIS domain-containing protein [Elusimicrobiota bacterium]MDE2426584.1 SIS domain-containing protein [Elusimicrobiota bacterium]
MAGFRGEIARQLRESGRVIAATAKRAAELERAAEMLIAALRRGNKILTFGNGGSSCDAQNFADELVGRYRRNRPPLPALCLACSQADLTSIANDFGYENVFSRQLEAHAKPGDVAVAISTSGNSKNVLAAARAARRLGLPVIGLTGAGGGKLKGLCDVAIAIASPSTARVQEAHIAVIQIWCGLIEDALFARAPKAHE